MDYTITANYERPHPEYQEEDDELVTNRNPANYGEEF
jgi:hypothetical protein